MRRLLCGEGVVAGEVCDDGVETGLTAARRP